MNFSHLMPEPGSPLDKVATFLMGNIIWFMLAAFILPLPAATAGLIATFAPWARGHDTEIFRTFFGAMRKHGFKSTVIVIIDLIILYLVVFNFQVINTMPQSPILWPLRSGNLFVALTLFMMNIYLWPLMVLFRLPLRRLVILSSQMSFAHPLWTMLVLLILLAVVIVALIVPPIVSVLTVFALISLVVNWGAWRVIKRYATQEEIAALNLSI